MPISSVQSQTSGQILPFTPARLFRFVPAASFRLTHTLPFRDPAYPHTYLFDSPRRFPAGLHQSVGCSNAGNGQRSGRPALTACFHSCKQKLQGGVIQSAKGYLRMTVRSVQDAESVRERDSSARPGSDHIFEHRSRMLFLYCIVCLTVSAIIVIKKFTSVRAMLRGCLCCCKKNSLPHAATWTR